MMMETSMGVQFGLGSRLILNWIGSLGCVFWGQWLLLGVKQVGGVYTSDTWMGFWQWDGWAIL
jgi:hypothetical protein